MTLEEFCATRFEDDADPLLEKHPDNPAYVSGNDRAYFSNNPPLRQYLYKHANGAFYLIAKQLYKEATVYAMWWGQGGDERYVTLPDAERALFEFIGSEG